MKELESEAVKDDDESIAAESDLQEINVESVPRPKKVPGQHSSKPKRSKKVLSEEFHIEEMDGGYETQPIKKAKSKRSKKRASPPKKQRTKDSSGSDVNYNSEKYHKKQHSL